MHRSKTNLKWLVTGSAGFIGSNLCQRLLARGDSVIGLDNLSTGKQANVDRLMSVGEGRYRQILGDICDPGAIEEGFADGIDVVVHLAAQGSVQKSFADVAFNNRQNIDGFVNMLCASGEHKIGQFIYASSCAVYGDTEVLPISESQCPDPVSPYASSKLMNDLLSRNLAHLYPQTKITGLRFFNIFGPWQDPFGDYAAVIPKWIDLCMEGKRPILYGNGSATRDFCYVGNVCGLIEKIGSVQAEHPGGVYNVASEVAVSLNELYEAVTAALAGKQISLDFDGPDYRPWREGDILHSLGSIELARRELGFEPEIDLRAGIELILSEQYGL